MNSTRNKEIEVCKNMLVKIRNLAEQAIKKGNHEPCLDAMNTLLLIDEVEYAIATLKGYQSMLPKHYDLTIEHIVQPNNKLTTAKEWIEDGCEPDNYIWENEESKNKAIELNSIWIMEYTKYFNGSKYKIASYSFKSLLEFAED